MRFALAQIVSGLSVALTLALSSHSAHAATILLDGKLSESVWADPRTTHIRFAYGTILAFSDGDTVFVGLDLTNDTHDDGAGHVAYPSKGDYFALIVDSNSDNRVDVDDTAYAPANNSLTKLLHYSCHVCRPQDIRYRPSGGGLAGGFGPSQRSPTPHRIWELAIPRTELPGSLRVWVQIRSDNPPINFDQFPSFESPGVDLLNPTPSASSLKRATPVPRGSVIASVQDDGTITLSFPDGSQVSRNGGTESATTKEGRTMTSSAAEVVRADPPTPPPQIKSYLDAHNQELKDILSTLLGGDQQSLGNYLQSEQSLGLYGQISKRTAAVEFIIQRSGR